MAKDIDMRNRGNVLMEIMHVRVHDLGWSPYSICRSLSGCWPYREAVALQGAAHRVNLSRRSAPHSNTASFGGRQSLKGSDRYSLRHRRRTCAATSTLRSLKGSYVYCRWHRHWQMDHPIATPSLKGSDKYDIIYSHNL